VTATRRPHVCSRRALALHDAGIEYARRIMPIPLEIVGLGKTEVRFVWDEGHEDMWPARELRLQCTCALCQSEMTGERILDPDSVPEDISVTHMEFVGNYGLSIHFSDGHTTGIYRWQLLQRSGDS
jgi:ATP-binding protein involved in chromosome partitioning